MTPRPSSTGTLACAPVCHGKAVPVTRNVNLIAASLSLAVMFFFAACKGPVSAEPAKPSPPFMAAVATPQLPGASDAPSPDKTAGFDGKRAYDLVAKQVSFGPRPSGSQAIVQLQNFLDSELKSYGCTVESDSFSADTPAGRLPMKNLLAKIPGERPGILLLATHYDTKRLDNFVGADDAGSSTGVMLELARHLCAKDAKRSRYAVWIAFFDGEEAVNKEWVDPDNRYGSRQMAAKFAVSGDLKKIRALILADIVGGHDMRIKREADSTKELTNLIWSTAARLGYTSTFVNDPDEAMSDDHDSFLKRGVPAVDLIAFDSAQGYWHTPQDTLDKISAKSLAIVGHVLLESLKQLQAK